MKTLAGRKIIEKRLGAYRVAANQTVAKCKYRPSPEVKIESPVDVALLFGVDSYGIGKSILSWKGKPKIQHQILKACGENFLLNMFFIFYKPVKVSMDTPDEVIKWMCRDILRVARDRKYARHALNEAKFILESSSNPYKNPNYLEGWVDFLKEYAEPERILTPEEQLCNLRRQIHETNESRAIFRQYKRIFTGTEKEEDYAKEIKELTAEGLELVRQYKFLKLKISEA